MATLALGVAPALAGGPVDDDPLAPYRLERGAFQLGFGVAPLKLDRLDPLASPPAAGGGAREPSALDLRTWDPGAAAISFDVKLRWPGEEGGRADAAPGLGGLRPYLSFGPALLVAQPNYSLLAGRADAGDYAMSLGLKGGAGITWQVDPNISLFGEYAITRAAENQTLPGTRSGESLDTEGFRYGLKIRF